MSGYPNTDPAGMGWEDDLTYIKDFLNDLLDSLLYYSYDLKDVGLLTKTRELVKKYFSGIE